MDDENSYQADRARRVHVQFRVSATEAARYHRLARAKGYVSMNQWIIANLRTDTAPDLMGELRGETVAGDAQNEENNDGRQL